MNEKELMDAIKFMKKELTGLAQANYIFENIVVPRAHADREVMNKLKEQVTRVEAVLTQLKNGEDVDLDELAKSIPQQFR